MMHMSVLKQNRDYRQSLSAGLGVITIIQEIYGKRNKLKGQSYMGWGESMVESCASTPSPGLDSCHCQRKYYS